MRGCATCVQQVKTTIQTCMFAIPTMPKKLSSMRSLLLPGKPLKRELTTAKEQADATRREQDATREMIEESNRVAEEQASERDSISAPLYKEYNRVKQILIMNGDSTHNAKIGAYRALLGTWRDQGGVDYYVVGMKIPKGEENLG